MDSKRYVLTLFAFLTLPLGSRADDEALRRCRALTDPAARLACYDALPLAASPTAVMGAPAVQGLAKAPSAAPKAVSSEADFGLAPRPADELPAIQSHIPGVFEGWRPNERIRLANGQVWQIADDTSNFIVRRDPRVTVRRGALGAFFLDIEGDNRSPRVRRVQ